MSRLGSNISKVIIKNPTVMRGPASGGVATRGAGFTTPPPGKVVRDERGTSPDVAVTTTTTTTTTTATARRSPPAVRGPSPRASAASLKTAGPTRTSPVPSSLMVVRDRTIEARALYVSQVSVFNSQLPGDMLVRDAVRIASRQACEQLGSSVLGDGFRMMTNMYPNVGDAMRISDWVARNRGQQPVIVVTPTEEKEEKKAQDAPEVLVRHAEEQEKLIQQQAEFIQFLQESSKERTSKLQAMKEMKNQVAEMKACLGCK
jgi:hypothetical protein